MELAERIAAFPQSSLRADRLSAMTQWGKPTNEAMATEFAAGLGALQEGRDLIQGEKSRWGS